MKRKMISGLLLSVCMLCCKKSRKAERLIMPAVVASHVSRPLSDIPDVRQIVDGEDNSQNGKGDNIVSRRYYSHELQASSFHQNQFLIDIPYMVAYRMGKDKHVDIISVHKTPASPPCLSVTGGNWGDYTIDTSQSVLQSLGGAKAHVHAEGTEQRIKLISEDGWVKIVTFTKTDIVPPGREWGAGFIIKKAEIINSRFVLDGMIEAVCQPDSTKWFPHFKLLSTVKLSEFVR